MYCLDNQQILHLSPDELIIHQKLIEIYGENENRPKLEKSIKREGIITPLEVSTRTGTNVVLSGKCRLQIARKLGLQEVPVRIGNYASVEQELNVLFDLNLHREGKTHFQKFVEGNYWESKLKPQAKEQQRENGLRQSALLNQKLSNLTDSVNDSILQQDVDSKIDVRSAVAEKLRLSTGSYHKR